MHAVDILEEALQLAAEVGFEIRQEWLGESAAGVCRIGTRRVLFVDLGGTASEQLRQVVRALRACDLPATRVQLASAELRNLLERA